MTITQGGFRKLVEYKVVSLAEAERLGYPPPRYTTWDDWSNDEYQSAIYCVESGFATKCLAVDGGEPEDNSFVRDGSWIAPALNAAYELGKAHRG